MSEAVEPDPYAIASFNEFFTRALRPDARPIAAGAAAIACPVDGTRERMRQPSMAIRCCRPRAGATRSTDCWPQQAWAARFAGGSFATIYLAPFNYHRVHMPVARAAARYGLRARAACSA